MTYERGRESEREREREKTERGRERNFISAAELLNH